MAHDVFIGVSSKAKKVIQPYIGIGNVAKKVVGGWIGDANNKARLFWGGDDMIKSITRGYIVVNSSGSGSSVNISVSNINKCVLMKTGECSGQTSNTYDPQIRLDLQTNSGQPVITAYVSTGDSGIGTSLVGYQLIEYY